MTAGAHWGPILGTIARSAPPTMDQPIDAGDAGRGRLRRFEEAVLPHLAAAHNLARWLTRSDRDAEDVVQTAYLRALQFFDGFHGVNPRAWLLSDRKSVV